MRHRERRARWEVAVELAAITLLAIPTSLLLFFNHIVWDDGPWTGTALLASLTIPPSLALTWIERRRRRPHPTG